MADIELPENDGEADLTATIPAPTPRPGVPKRLPCAITGKMTPRRGLVELDTLRPALADLIKADHPDLADDALIARAEVNKYRSDYVEALLAEEHGEFSELDRQVAESIANQDTIAENVEEEFDELRTFGQRVSDLLAAFGGSWTFLLSFAGFMGVWMVINGLEAGKAFDPFPYILLNLILSTLAAVQAPIIMMSQRRQEQKDRLRSLNEYRVNLKAELEIRHLHEKMDHLITRQWQRLAEIQQIQLEIMQERRQRRK